MEDALFPSTGRSRCTPLRVGARQLLGPPLSCGTAPRPRTVIGPTVSACCTRLRIAAALPDLRRLDNSPACALPSFLCATRRALHTAQPVLYHHNGDVYRMLIKSEPAENGRRLARCVISKVGDSHELEFRLWFGGNELNGLPVRIQFHPKSFLKLTLEVDSFAKGSVLRPMLGQI